MVLVGYTEDAWIIQNSFSVFWGDKGYIYVDINTELPSNVAVTA